MTFLRCVWVTRWTWSMLVLFAANVSCWYLVQPGNQCSAPRTPDEIPFFFGISDLGCTATGINPSLRFFRRKRHAPSRNTLELTHSWILYDGIYFEFGIDPINGLKMPFTSNSKVALFVGLPFRAETCPWRRNPFPAGFSSLPVSCLQQCAARFETYFGGYDLLLNNCHHFVNVLADILCSNQCPPWCEL